MDRQTLSIMKACEAVGVSRRTIYNWISAGKVEYVRTAGGSIRIFADTLWRDSAAPPRALAASSTNRAGRQARKLRRMRRVPIPDRNPWKHVPNCGFSSIS